jgi:heterodisulfide reductase subunit A
MQKKPWTQWWLPLRIIRWWMSAMNTTFVGSDGEAPNLKVTLKNASGEEVVEVGSVIVSTGFQHVDPGKRTQMYGYYEFDDVITLVDAEKKC